MICWKAWDFDGGCENGWSISRLIVISIFSPVGGPIVCSSFVRISAAEGVSNE